MSLPLKGSKFEKVHCLIVRDKIIVLDLALLKKELEEKQTEISDLKEDLRIVRQGEYTNLSVRPFFIKKQSNFRYGFKFFGYFYLIFHQYNQFLRVDCDNRAISFFSIMSLRP